MNVLSCFLFWENPRVYTVTVWGGGGASAAGRPAMQMLRNVFMFQDLSFFCNCSL